MAQKIVLASTNPVKEQATLEGFRRMFPGEEFTVEMVAVPSGVSYQPMSDAETLQGAWNRAQNAAGRAPGADYWVGIEGGVAEMAGALAAFAWVVVCSGDRSGQARTGTFFLPDRVGALVRQGKELGEADDIVFNRSNSKQENGAIGILTGNVIDRVQLYAPAVVLALVPFKHPAWYALATAAHPGGPSPTTTDG
ncbi:MAG: non-canonical purine NTP phosphatase [Chloroflexi bacterium]|nr:non-canonical purine NTP phosphatase [Chloroflexota bacterium]